MVKGERAEMRLRSYEGGRHLTKMRVDLGINLGYGETNEVKRTQLINKINREINVLQLLILILI